MVYFCHETIQDRCSRLLSCLGTQCDSISWILRLLQLNQWKGGKSKHGGGRLLPKGSECGALLLTFLLGRLQTPDLTRHMGRLENVVPGWLAMFQLQLLPRKSGQADVGGELLHKEQMS